MGLNVALQDAMTGLHATQAQIQVISANIANAQTPGYSRQSVSQTPIIEPAGGVGVEVGPIVRASDVILTGNLVRQTTAASAASTTDDYLANLQGIIGQVGASNSFTDGLNTFINAMQTVAATPENAVAQTAAVNAGQMLAQQLNSFSAGIQRLRSNADSDIGNSVTTLNTALQSIGTLNAQISRLAAVGQSTATLQDQRDQTLNQVAQLMGVSSYTRPDGSMVVIATTGQTLVDGTTVSQLNFSPAGAVAANTPLSPVTLNGINITASLTTGKIGALLQLRDTTLPGVTAELNQLTNNLFNATTQANFNTTNSGLGVTSDAKHFFAAVDTGAGLDNAATIQVNPSLVTSPSLLYNGIAGVDPTITSTITANLTANTAFAAAGNLSAQTATLGNYGAQMIGQAATASAQASQNSTYQSQLQSQMQNQLDSETGVSLDQELSKLTIYQNSYAASARMISTIQQMYDSLMQIAS